jgi:hypothetical protein
VDHQEFAQLLGNYGEFVGAIAVVATLFYLAVQVRHNKAATEANTRAMGESRRLAMAQTYQARASTSFSAFASAAETGGMAPILVKYEASGYEALSPEDRIRFGQYARSIAIWFDNMFYQYEQGYLDADFYESTIRLALRTNAKVLMDAEMHVGRPKFREEVERATTDLAE